MSVPRHSVGGHPIRVLHLFSNAKWTGPAEPALNLCVALRALGVEADFACAPHAGASINKVVETSRDRGIEPILDMQLSKHRHPVKNFLDRRLLSRILRHRNYDLVHCHLDNDHGIATGPAQRTGIPLIRSNYEGAGLADTPRNRRLLQSAARLIEPSEMARRHNTEVLGAPAGRSVVIPNAVDVARFDPARETPDGRRWLGLAPDAFVVGIVARLQKHRHYDDLFRGFRALVDEEPAAQLVVVGRGTHQQKVGFGPVREMDLEDRVHFTGFIDGENFVGMLRAFDVGVYLTPGSDGTCRAVREIMAMAKPVVVAKRGMLAEIVTDGETGSVCDGSAESLYEALITLARDRRRKHTLGQAARQHAVQSYSLEAQSQAVLALYRDLLGGAPTS